MKKNFLLVALLLSWQKNFAQYHYPATKTVDSSDTYFGITVKDPYRWLENLNDSSVIKWFKAQADYSKDVMSKVPGQQTIINELEQFDKVKSAETYNEWIAGKGFIVTKRLPGQQMGKYYYRSTPDAKDVLLFDPTAYRKGKVMDVNHLDVSADGKYVLLQLSEQGKEGGYVHIMQVQTGKWLPDEIKYVGWFMGFMANNSNEIIYQEQKNDDIRSKDARLNNRTMLHIIGTAQSNDREILSRAKYSELGFDSSDVPALLTFYGCPYMFALKPRTPDINVEMYYAPLKELKNDKINWKPFCKDADEIKSINAHGSNIYCRTSKGNNHYRLLELTLPKGSLETAQEIYAGDKDWKIKSFDVAKDYMLISLSKNGLIRKTISYDYASGKSEEIHSPLAGNTYISSYAPFTNKCQVFTLGWNVLFNYYEYDLESRQFSNGPIHVNFNYPGMNDLVAEEVEVPSYDGTLVSLSIVYNKKYFKKDGNNICMLYGYGSYGSSIAPAFGYEFLPLLNRGIIMAYAHVRGGGEKGQDWHLAGQKTTKPNTWKDFNACAEWLVKNGYTSYQKLGCEGGSAGGILIGRAITERPDLYKVAIPEVGLLNTIRSETAPGGTTQIQEFGTMKDSAEAKALIEMDALNHVKLGMQYPAQLIITGFNDPRVASWMPGKFAAAMQSAKNAATPSLLYVNYEGGHFGGSAVNEHFAETALKYAFLLWQCGDKEFQLK